MRSIFPVVVIASASIVIADGARAEKRYTQAIIIHQQSVQQSAEKTIGAGQVHVEEDALTKRIKSDNAQIDHLIDICPSC